MQLKQRGRVLIAIGVVASVLVGGGVGAITPAGAVVSEFAATNWQQIWKQKIKPRTDKRYYTKKKSNKRYYTKPQSNSTFATKSELATTILSYYTKAQTDALLANYYTKAQSDANYYTKAQSDAKYYTKAPLPELIRGTTVQDVQAIGTNSTASASISFGVTLSAAPTAHYIPLGATLPVGCSGTVRSPNAEPGHLCVFEAMSENKVSQFIRTPTDDPGGDGATPYGTLLVARAVAAGRMFVTTSWAVRPIALAAP